MRDKLVNHNDKIFCYLTFNKGLELSTCLSLVETLLLFITICYSFSSDYEYYLHKFHLFILWNKYRKFKEGE